MKSYNSMLVILILITANLITACNDNKAIKNISSSLNDMKPDIERGGQKFGGRAVAASRNPTSNNELIVASESGGLFKTINHGVDWKQVSGSTTFWFSNIKYFPIDASIVFATANKDTRVISGGGIYRSQDGGDSWSHVDLPTCPCGQIDNLSAYSIDVDPASNRIWVGTSCGLVYSDDKGITWVWTNQPKYSYSSIAESVESVIVPVVNHLKVVTEKGIRVSDDNGLSWSYPYRPSFTNNNVTISKVYPGAYNELACSPSNDKHLFYTFKYDDAESHSYSGLFFSPDNGATWKNIRENIPEWRRPFVKVVPALNSFPNQMDIYYSDGALVLEKATFFTEGTSLKKLTGPGPWTPLKKANAHEDVSDMVFETDGKTPLLITTDGGVAITQDKGLNWTQTGAGSHGFCALQINSLSGQTQGKNSDLYFTTQDNWTWASTDDGVTWPYVFAVEGSFIQLPRKKFPNRRILTFWGLYGRNLTRPLFEDNQLFPSITNTEEGTPCFISPGTYVQNAYVVTQNPAAINNKATTVNLTIDTGTSWTPKIAYAEAFLDVPKTSGNETSPVIYQAISAPSTSPDWKIVGIKRINDILGDGRPVISNVSGFGSLGSFPRELADAKVFAADPADPNHLIVPDIFDNNVKVTFDGGQNWPVDVSLTKFVTNNGEFSFSWSSGTSHAFTLGESNSQITSIEFDPRAAGRILVGTMQAGVFISCDNGATWQKAPSSQLIPEVSGFYFTGNNTVIVSSYGRGLWELSLPLCVPVYKQPIERKLPNFPVIYWRGTRFPLSQIHNADICAECGFFIVNDGDITNYKINKENNTLTQVALSSGKIIGYGADAKKLSLPFTITRSEKHYNSDVDTTLTQMLSKNDLKIKGLYLEGNILKGLILSDKDITLSQLPQPEERQPTLFADAMSYMEDTTDSKKIKVYGSGFIPQMALSILLDGVLLTMDEKPQFSTEGNFIQSIKHLLSPGRHTIIAEQLTKEKSIRAGFTFFIPIQEE